MKTKLIALLSFIMILSLTVVACNKKTTTSEKIVAWRYLSMLGNPKTHIRNIVSKCLGIDFIYIRFSITNLTRIRFIKTHQQF